MTATTTPNPVWIFVLLLVAVVAAGAVLGGRRFLRGRSPGGNGSTTAMLAGLTVSARNALVSAQQETRAVRHDHIGTEHLLLGLLREGEGDAARILTRLGVSSERVREAAARLTLAGESDFDGPLAFAPQTTRALEHGRDEAVARGQNHTATTHLLLGLTREPESVAAQVLTGLLGGEADRLLAQEIDRSHRAES